MSQPFFPRAFSGFEPFVALARAASARTATAMTVRVMIAATSTA